MNTPPPTGNPTVWLTLQAHDAAALIDYYTTTFGFVVAARCDGDGDTVAHAELHWPQGTGAIMLGSYRPGRPWCRQPGTAGGYVVTADPDALYPRVLVRRHHAVLALTQTDNSYPELPVRQT